MFEIHSISWTDSDSVKAHKPSLTIWIDGLFLKQKHFVVGFEKTSIWCQDIDTGSIENKGFVDVDVLDVLSNYTILSVSNNSNCDFVCKLTLVLV